MRRRSGNARLTLPLGYTDSALLFDNQSNDSLSVTLLTISEAAKILRISVSGVRRLQQGRNIPFFKVRGGIRFATSDLLSYLARQRVESIDI